jgi:type IV fimbrial biogenesis protein FimT
MGTRKKLRSLAPEAAGFTLMELLIVIALAALILAIGAPNFNEFRRNNRLTGAANDLLGSIQLARTEAIKRQQNVSVCTSLDPGSATPSCSAGTFTGWIVFEDIDGNCTRDAVDSLIRGGGPVDASLRSAADGTCITFADTGFARDHAAGVGATRLLFCDERGTALQAGTSLTAARGIELSRTGRAQITREPDVIGGWELACP